MIFYFFLLILLILKIESQSYIEALNISYPFRTGSKTGYSFNTSNIVTILLDLQLSFTPTSTSLFIGINGYNNNILTGTADTKLTTTPSNLSATGFTITVDINWPTYFSLLSYSFAFFDPSWNVLKFYSTGYIMNSSLTMSPSMIDNQPISNIKNVCWRSFQIGFLSTIPPFYLSIWWNGTEIAVSFLSSINYTYFEATIVTLNSSTPFNNNFALQWNVDHSNITSAASGTLIETPFNADNCMLYFIVGWRKTVWSNRAHIGFIYQQEIFSNSIVRFQSYITYTQYKFVTIHFAIENCSNASYPYLLYGLQRCYDDCPTGYYNDLLQMRCRICTTIPNCTKCATYKTCAKCNSTYKMILDQNGLCVDCNPDPTDTQSSMPLCYQEDQITPEPDPEPQQETQINPEDYSCVLNENLSACVASDATVTFAVTFTSVVSVPTLSMFTSAFTQLIGLFDDFSYYLYHNRVYSRFVQVYFELANSFTLDRFYPPQLQHAIEKVQFTYSDDILFNDLGKTPDKFKQSDGDIYFLKNTESFFLGTTILSVAVFIIMAFINFLTNKCFKHKLLKRYSYSGMLIVNLLGGNIQYITFRCIEQLYQTVPLTPMYILNLGVCYLMLFLTIIFSICGMTIFKNIYNQVKEEYVSQQLFDSSFNNWFIITNLLKFCNGFIHAYFYNDPFIQQGLLVLSYAIKFATYLSFIKKVQQKTSFIFELICNFLMLVFQSILFAQLFLIEYGQYNSVVQNAMGQLEFAILMLLFGVQILSPILVGIKATANNIRNRFFFKPPKMHLKDIRVIANTGQYFVDMNQNKTIFQHNFSPDQLNAVQYLKLDRQLFFDNQKINHETNLKNNLQKIKSIDIKIKKSQNQSIFDSLKGGRKLRKKNFFDQNHEQLQNNPVSSINQYERDILPVKQTSYNSDNNISSQNNSKYNSQCNILPNNKDLKEKKAAITSVKQKKFKPREGMKMFQKTQQED